MVASVSAGNTNPTAMAEELLATTRAMLQAARGSDWPAVAAHEIQRQYQNEKLFADDIPAEHRDAVAAILRLVLDHDPELKRLVDSAREVLSREAQKTRTGHNAVRAYQRNSQV